MEPFAIIVKLAWAAIFGIVLSSHLALWQRKEYRLDRFWSHIYSSEWPKAHKFTEVALAIAVITQAHWLGFVALAIHHGYQALNRGVSRPKATNRVLLITLVILAISSFTISRFGFAPTTFLLPVIIYISTLIANIPVTLRKQDIIAQAKKLRQQHSNLKVVGITGSYGKTSTKHFLKQILTHSDINFAISQAHVNSELPVAQDMLKQINPNLEVYIAEMGAYRKGEIKALCDLAQPHIGVITAISNQHVSLFGSIEKLAQAKWELIENLNLNGTAVLNADDKVIMHQNVSAHPGTKIFYSSHNYATSAVSASNTHYSASSISTAINIGSQSRQIDIPLVGEGALHSILAAIAIAHTLKVPAETIFQHLTKLQPVPRTMELVRDNIIDDSYSANEHGVITALKQLARMPQTNKLVIMPPLIELGDQASSAHQNIGRALAESKAGVIITGTAYQKDILKGFGNNTDNIHFTTSPHHAIKLIKKYQKQNPAVLIAGRAPDTIRQAILSFRT